MDANLRTPSSPHPFKVNNDYGLTDALRSPGPITEFVTCVGPENLAVLSCDSGAKRLGRAVDVAKHAGAGHGLAQ